MPKKNIRWEEPSEETRLSLLEECKKMKLPVMENDDYEILQLLFDAAKEREQSLIVTYERNKDY